MDAANAKRDMLSAKEEGKSLTREKVENLLGRKHLTNIPKKRTKKGEECLYPHFFFLPSADVIKKCTVLEKKTLRYCAICSICGEIKLFDQTSKRNLDNHITTCHRHLSKAITASFKQTKKRNTIFNVCRLKF